MIVVGAGPAGATTAMLLARAGADVLLLDRHHFPRHKACGDCLSAGANAVLSRLGLLASIDALPHAQLRGWRIVAPGGSSFCARFVADQTAFAVERHLLDATILRAALDAGARLRVAHVTDVLRAADGTITGVCTRDAILRARVVVGADGLRSIIATRLGAVSRRPRIHRLSLTAHIDRALLGDDVGEMHTGHGLCVGIAPVTASGTRCNITVVVDADRLGRAAARDPRAFMAAAFAQLPGVRERVSAADLADVRLLASGPFDRPVSNVVFDGAVLVGDAAGYYDPFTGQGIFQAVASAELLAHCLTRSLRLPVVRAQHLAEYAAQRRRLLDGARIVQHAIHFILARPTCANRAIARVARAPRFAQALLGVTGDMLPAGVLLSPRVLGSFLLPALLTECP